MNIQSRKRRRFIRTSLAVPLLSNLPLNYFGVNSIANAMTANSFQVPEKIYHELFMIYGGDANEINQTENISLNAPLIAENGAVVPISVTGEKGLVSSLAIFVDQSPKALISTSTLHEGSDLPVSTRIKVEKTSDIYVIAKTSKGLVGVRKKVKVTIGCGGG